MPPKLFPLYLKNVQLTLQPAQAPQISQFLYSSFIFLIILNPLTIVKKKKKNETSYDVSFSVQHIPLSYNCLFGFNFIHTFSIEYLMFFSEFFFLFYHNRLC
mgnify:CR=1 FL=1